MKLFLKKSIWLFSTVLLVSITSVDADTKITIGTSEQLNLLGKKWECRLKGPNITGYKSFFEFDNKISLKKVTGKARSEYCPTGWGNIKGKFSNGTLIMKVSNMPSPCTPIETIVVTFYKSEDSSYYSKGHHSWSLHNGFSGTYTSTCTQVVK